MDKDALLQRLMKTFVEELGEHTQALDRDLLALERAQNEAASLEIVKSLFRTAHSLKGAARSVDVEMLESAGHWLESIFASARDHATRLDPRLVALLFAVTDAIKDMSHRLASGEETATSPLAALMPRLEAAELGSIQDVLPGSAQSPPDESGTESELALAPSQEDAASAISRRDVSVRIASAKLDRLLALSGEMRIARSRAETRQTDVQRLQDTIRRWDAEWRMSERLAHVAPTIDYENGAHRSSAQVRQNLQWMTREFDSLASRLAADRKAFDQIADALESEIMKARMVPFTEACEGLERGARDLAKNAGKEIYLTIDGGEIEIDRSIAECIKSPLLHLVRNAVDHGIESPATRIAAGKPPHGQITLSAALQNGRVEITIADDGKGFDAVAIREEARRRNMPVPESEREMARLAFAPGFSTSPTVTPISGRGIGLDVVKTAVESQRGEVDVASKPGAGTRFTLSLPLSSTLLPALLVIAGGQTYALDSTAVRGLLRVEASDLRPMEGRDVLTFNGSPVPVFHLPEVLGQPTHEMQTISGKASVVILGSGADLAAFTVDELWAESEIVAKGLGPRLQRIRGISGATILPTGRIALILNAAELVDAAFGRAATQALSAILAEEPAEAKKHLLIVEDSVTTRTLVKSILETAGYDVTTAVDGMEAWQFLQEKGADLVVSDIEMPRMDGFALTEAIRASKRFRTLPIILVTAMETERDKIRGLEAGADAYLMKSAFDQTELIQTINQML